MFHNKSKQSVRPIHYNDATRKERQISMSINSPQSARAGDELHNIISRQPSISQLYSDAAAYEKLLAQLEPPLASGENSYSFAALVDSDSTDTNSILSRSSKL